jgi:hypothetical protein
MESTIEYLQRKLKEAGPSTWPAIASVVNKGLEERYRVSRHTLRKIAYGDRPNLGSVKGDALRAYFQKREKADVS